jgi:hypothetical protein
MMTRFMTISLWIALQVSACVRDQSLGADTQVHPILLDASVAIDASTAARPPFDAGSDIRAILPQIPRTTRASSCSRSIACPADTYCMYSVDAQCGAGSRTGDCVTRPSFCTTDYIAVCGCDGKLYSDVCAAALAAVATSGDTQCMTANADDAGTQDAGRM